LVNCAELGELELPKTSLGSYASIPVAQLPPERVESGKIVTVFGVPHVVPVVHEWPGTILAVNVDTLSSF